MSENLTIIDNEYTTWIEDLIKQHHRSQIKAAHSVNKEMLSFYWSLGRDIEELHTESRWSNKFFKNLYTYLKRRIPNVTSFSPTNFFISKIFIDSINQYYQLLPMLAIKLRPQQLTTPTMVKIY